MRIEISRSGGFAGLTRTWTLEVSPDEAEERWLPLAHQAAAAPGADPSGRERDQRDRYVYHIVIGYQEVTLPESRLDEPWKELIDRARRGTTG
ncbi:protealysin inhibitor emfourin [Arthrobacter sp. TMN-37]